MEKSLDVGGFGYPALIAYSPKDQKFSTMKRWVTWGGCVWMWVTQAEEGIMKRLALGQQQSFLMTSSSASTV
jgi:hypothetical protein